jgi:ABC-type Co2+ transport system permease subunit
LISKYEAPPEVDMTHIMVPDGVLPPWIWIPGWGLAIVCIALALWATRNSDRARMVPLAGVMAAVMTIVMSLEIAPLAYEPHLTVLAGIVLGPAYGFLAAFVFNVLRMLLGDGSVTLLGLNTLILGAETVGGYLLFRLFTRGRPTQASAGLAAGGATLVSLAIATLIFLAVIAVGLTELHGLELGEELLERTGDEEAGFPVFAQLVLTLGAIGWAIEAIVTGAVAGFLRAVRPSLLSPARA